MARKPRFSPGGLAYHTMNRTWGNIELFQDSGDYEAFERVLAEGIEREKSIRLCAYGLMPNHFHMVLWPRGEGQLSRFMQWVSMTHAARWHAHRHTSGRGHLYQSRFKSFAIQEDGHFLSVARYVERNALRANLVDRAERWRWSSAWARSDRETPLNGLLSAWPVEMPEDWSELLNHPQSEAELAALHVARDRGRPYGETRWMEKTAQRLGIESSLRPIGRPGKQPKVERNGL